MPIVGVLRAILAAEQLKQPQGEALCFGIGENGRPFSAPTGCSSARNAGWAVAELNRVTLHECRHGYASLAIAAGVNAKALSTYMGHVSITETMDRYGHLLPGNENEAAALIDDYLNAGIE